MHSLGVSLESDCLMATPSAILFRHDNALSTSRVDILCLFCNVLCELELQNVLRHGDKSAGKCPL